MAAGLGGRQDTFCQSAEGICADKSIEAERNKGRRHCVSEQPIGFDEVT